jgi:hypothetical protein
MLIFKKLGMGETHSDIKSSKEKFVNWEGPANHRNNVGAQWPNASAGGCEYGQAAA